jgi:putative sugar O-methyltransferase
VTELSPFWEKLASEHAGELDRFGFEAVKRRQALRYFNWRWHWSSVHLSRQMRFLLAHASLATLLRCSAAPARLSGPLWEDVPWSRRDRWLYVFAVRLLWEYALRHDELDVLELPEPTLGGPLPVEWRGRLISQDLANTALEATAIARALGGESPRSIVEVGAGYGRTAYALLSAYPDATYTVVDIEPALTISRWYLTQLFEPGRLRFIEPGECGGLEESSVDLVVAVSSLHELSNGQVRRYLGLFDRIARGGVVYLKQWEHWTNPEDPSSLDLGEYPIPGSWEPVFDEAAPVQTNFRQAAWRVPRPERSRARREA